jgi:hypothetical protein
MCWTSGACRRCSIACVTPESIGVANQVLTGGSPPPSFSLIERPPFFAAEDRYEGEFRGSLSSDGTGDFFPKPWRQPLQFRQGSRDFDIGRHKDVGQKPPAIGSRRYLFDEQTADGGGVRAIDFRECEIERSLDLPAELPDFSLILLQVAGRTATAAAAAAVAAGFFMFFSGKTRGKTSTVWLSQDKDSLLRTRRTAPQHACDYARETV